MKIENEGCIVGLDASSTVVGYCVWNKEVDELEVIDHFEYQSSDMLEKVDEFDYWLDSMLKQNPLINEIVIEDYLSAYSGASSADIIIKLAQINFACRYICRRAGLKINTISITNSRKYGVPLLKLRHKAKAGGKGHKEQVFDHVYPILGEETLPKRIITKGKNKGVSVPVKTSFDRCDAFVVCKGFLNFRDSN